MNYLIKIEGQSFRCYATARDRKPCGANVFSEVQNKRGENRFECNGCGATYEGVK